MTTAMLLIKGGAGRGERDSGRREQGRCRPTSRVQVALNRHVQAAVRPLVVQQRAVSPRLRLLSRYNPSFCPVFLPFFGTGFTFSLGCNIFRCQFVLSFLNLFKVAGPTVPHSEFCKHIPAKFRESPSKCSAAHAINVIGIVANHSRNFAGMFLYTTLHICAGPAFQRQGGGEDRGTGEAAEAAAAATAAVAFIQFGARCPPDLNSAASSE